MDCGYRAGEFAFMRFRIDYHLKHLRLQKEEISYHRVSMFNFSGTVYTMIHKTCSDICHMHLYMHANTYSHTHTHTHTYTCTHTCMHARACACMHACTHTHTHTNTCMHRDFDAHVHINCGIFVIQSNIGSFTYRESSASISGL